MASLAELADPAIRPDPYPVLARLRQASPFAEADGTLLIVGRHAQCSQILRDPRASSQRGRSLAGRPPRTPSFLSLDPPDHTRLRRLVASAFSPRVIAGLAPRIHCLSDQLLDAAGAASESQLEVVSQLAYPLPVQIICELLGVPAADHARFAGWSARLVHSLQPSFPPDPALTADADEAREQFAGYFRELIRARRASPAGDLLSGLIQAEHEGDRLTQDELIATCVLLLVAGHETTVSLISNAVLALLRHPDQLAALCAEPGLAAGAVEETLRYDAPVQLTGRVARGGMDVAGLDVADGTVLVLLLAAAGRDPDVFADPDRFDIRRGAAQHLAFAAGPHFCLGAPLARLEAAIMLQAFASRVIGPWLDEPELAYKPNLNLRGPQHLAVGYAGIRPAGPA